MSVHFDNKSSKFFFSFFENHSSTSYLFATLRCKSYLIKVAVYKDILYLSKNTPDVHFYKNATWYSGTTSRVALLPSGDEKFVCFSTPKCVKYNKLVYVWWMLLLSLTSNLTFKCFIYTNTLTPLGFCYLIILSHICTEIIALVNLSLHNSNGETIKTSAFVVTSHLHLFEIYSNLAPLDGAVG